MAGQAKRRAFRGTGVAEFRLFSGVGQGVVVRETRPLLDVFVGVAGQRAYLVVEGRANSGERRKDERELGHCAAEHGVARFEEVLEALPGDGPGGQWGVRV